MINDMALKLATKDFISSGVLRWHLIGIVQGQIPPTPPYGGSIIDSPIDIPKKAKKFVSVIFEYEDKIYTQTKYIKQNVIVTAEMIEVETINNEPVVKIIL